MLKRIISLLLALVMIISCSSVVFSASAATDNTIAVLTRIYKKFPAGKYWNHYGKSENDPDMVTNTPCSHSSHSGCSWSGGCPCNKFDRSFQCMGFAHKVSFDITGKSPRDDYTQYNTFDLSAIRVGDVIRMRGGKHSVCVVGVDYEAEKIAIAHANWDYSCGIFWDIWNVSDLTGKYGPVTYVLHLEGNDRKNTDLDFFKSIKIDEDDYIQDDEPEDKPETKPEIKDCDEVWKMSNTANVNIRSSYSTSAAVIGSISAGSEFNVTQKYDDGTYVWGKVNHNGVSGWCVLNYAECIDDGTKKVEVSSIKLSKTSVTVYAGSSQTLTATVSPSDASNKSLKWVSADTSVATVSSSGKITGKKPGTTTVTCSATDGSGVKKTCKVTVYPGEVTLKQDIPATTATKVVFTWNKLDGCKSYNVYKYDGTQKKYNLVKNTSGTSYTETNLKAGRTYAYIVKAVATVNSKTVNGQSVKITCYTDPAAVKGIKQTYSTSKSVTLSWNKVSNATYYVVYKYNKTKKDYERMGETKETSFACPMDPANATYFLVYAVRQTDTGYFNSASSAKFVGISGPDKPVVKATAGKKSVKLTWGKKTSSTRYDVYRYNGKKYVRIAKLSSSNNTYTDKNLTSGKYYYYKVRAINTKSSTTAYGSYSATVKVKAK